MRLYRIYAVLCLTLGLTVTNQDVHDAWAAWCAGERPNHKSLVPFEDLSPEVQRLDSKYRTAIYDVSVEL